MAGVLGTSTLLSAFYPQAGPLLPWYGTHLAAPASVRTYGPVESPTHATWLVENAKRQYAKQIHRFDSQYEKAFQRSFLDSCDDIMMMI